MKSKLIILTCLLIYTILISLYIILVTAPVRADDSCIQSNWSNINKVDEKLGYISTYLTDQTDLKIENLLCILGSEFFRNISDFPDNAVVGIVSKDLSTGYLAKWSLTKNTLILIKFNGNMGLANIYPKPLERLEELFTNKKFPSPSSPNAILRRSVHSKKILIDVKAMNLLTAD
jgi:hypothetical protein